MIYIDLYFLRNLIIDFLLLYLVACTRRYARHPLRFLTGAAIDALASSLILILQQHNLPYTAFSALLQPLAESALLCAIAYHPKKLRQWFAQIGWLWLATLLAGGTLNWLYYHTSLGFGLQSLLQGSLPVPSATWLVMAMVGFCGTAGILYHSLRVENNAKMVLFDARIYRNGEKVGCKALLDTGNRLYAPGGRPVNLIDFAVAKTLLQAEEICWLEFYFAWQAGKTTEELQPIPRSIRLIPFNSVGKAGGVLPMIIAEQLEVPYRTEIRVTKQAAIAISADGLSGSGKYRMILHVDCC